MQVALPQMEVAFITCKAKIKMIKNSVILKANWLSKSCCPQVISCCPCIAFRAMEFIIPGYAHSWHNCAYSVGYILFFLGVEMLDLQASPFLINFPCARTLRKQHRASSGPALEQHDIFTGLHQLQGIHNIAWAFLSKYSQSISHRWLESMRYEVS